MSDNNSISNLIYTPSKSITYTHIDYIAGLFPRGGISVVAAASGTGKTWFMFHCMIQASKGLDVFGNEDKAYKSLYFHGELLNGVFDNRLRATQHLEPDVTKIGILDGKGLVIEGNCSCSLSEKDFRTIVHKAIQESKPDAVIFDSFGNFNTADENSTKEMTEVFKWLLKLANYYKIAVIVVHHLRKKSNNDKDRKRTMDDISGNSAITKFSSAAYNMEKLSVSSSSSTTKTKVSVEQVKTSDKYQAPFIFIVASDGEEEDMITNFEVRDANDDELRPVTQQTITQDNQIRNIILPVVNAKNEMRASDIIVEVHKVLPEVNDRIIRDVLLKMTKQGEILRPTKDGREFVYTLPDDMKEKLNAVGAANL